MKKFLFIFLSSLLFQQIIAQTIVKFGNGKNLKYKDLQGNYSAPPMGMSNRLTVVLQQELH